MASLAAVLAETNHLSLESNNRIKCSITGHEMLADLASVQAYLNGKKLRKAREWYSFDYSVFEPHIIASKKNPKKGLYCTLTDTELNKIPKQVQDHVAGRKYQLRKAEFEAIAKKKEFKANRRAAKQAAYTSDDDHEGPPDFWMPPESDDEDEDEGDNAKYIDEEDSEDDWIITTDKLNALKTAARAAGTEVTYESDDMSEEEDEGEEEDEEEEELKKPGKRKSTISMTGNKKTQAKRKRGKK